VKHTLGSTQSLASQNLTPHTHETQFNLNPIYENNYDHAITLSTSTQSHTQDTASNATFTKTDEEAMITHNMNGDTEVDTTASNGINDSPSQTDADMVT